MKNLLPIVILMYICFSCNGQTKTNKKGDVGGPCEGCEALYEYGKRTLSTTTTLPKFQETEPKLKVSGTVYKKDGKTPAENVILYVYHTNRGGIYETKGDETGWARRHGFIRGWMKTDKNGQYSFYTFRPASYPNTTALAHIHITIKEPNTNAYYIDDFVFDDDPYLDSKSRSALRDRGGSGVLSLIKENGIWTAKRDIVLGLNIPNYK